VSEPLNIREAEERAKAVRMSLGKNGVAACAEDFLTLAALYREAVAALEHWTAHLEYVSPEITRVLAKARAALGVE